MSEVLTLSENTKALISFPWRPFRFVIDSRPEAPFDPETGCSYCVFFEWNDAGRTRIPIFISRSHFAEMKQTFEVLGNGQWLDSPPPEWLVAAINSMEKAIFCR